MSGKLVVVEGPDGSGKSTLARLLGDYLGSQNIPCQVLREPGGTPLGEAIREILRDPTREISPRAETLLFCAARAALADRIRQALETDWVILDRFEGSTAVYQGIVRGLGRDDVLRISRWASDGLQADLSLVVLVSEKTSLERRRGRGEEDRMEATTDLRAVLEGYSWLSQQPGHAPVSGEGSPEDALREAISLLHLDKEQK